METNVNYTVVGAFVLLLMTFTLLAIIWLSSGFSDESFSRYLVYMQESVTGLSPESPVEFNGVKVGTVESIELYPNNPHLVQLLLNIKSSTPITTGTVAVLSSRGVTGVTFIQLKDDGTNLAMLKAAKGQRYPVIKTAPSLLVRLDTALSQLSKNLQNVSASIQSVLNQQNQHAIQESLQNLQLITRNIAANDRHMTQIMRNTASLTQQFTPMVKMLNTQILPQSYELLMKLNLMSENIAQVAALLKQNPSMLVRGTPPQKLGPGEKP